MAKISLKTVKGTGTDKTPAMSAGHTEKERIDLLPW